MTTVIGTNSTFPVAIRLAGEHMPDLGLKYREHLQSPNQFGLLSGPATATPTHVGTQVPHQHNAPVPVPNKLDINDIMDLIVFTPKAIQGLSRTPYIQRWYNVLHSRGRVWGVYTVPWERFSNASFMGDTCNSTSLDQAVLDRKDLMSAALHCLLSSPGMFTGDCAKFPHLISNSPGDGYLGLYQIVRLSHPLLGQCTVQPAQPQQKRNQPFSENISHCIDYFQS
jgi:hypothetical protein